MSVDQRLIEELSGEGDVYRENGEFVVRKKYRIEIYQEMHSAREEEVAGLKDIVGWLENGDDMIPLVGQNDLILHLDDGRRLKFLCADTSGMITDRGGHGLYMPEDK